VGVAKGRRGPKEEAASKSLAGKMRGHQLGLDRREKVWKIITFGGKNVFTGGEDTNELVGCRRVTE